MKFQILAAAVFATLTGFAAADCGRVYIDELTPPPADCTRHTKKGDFVTVDYKGYFPNGTLFDQSYGSEDGPFSYQYGVGKVIKGFDEGLKGMCVGEKRWVLIPSVLGYGVKGAGDGLIPPNSTLIFEILLEQIKDKAKRGRPLPVISERENLLKLN